MNNVEIQENKSNVYGCTKCGAELKYKPGTDKLLCEYCGETNEIPKTKVEIKELNFDDYIKNIENEKLTLEKVIQCKSCGASSNVKGELKSLHCPYCSAPLVEEDIHEERIIKPDYIIPFQIDQNKVYDLLANWVNDLWFAPNNLQKAALSPIGLKGVYVPYWTYDSSTTTQYVGKRGENYTVEVGSGDKRRTETRTRWYNVSGSVFLFIDDVMVPASGNIDSKSLSKLEPWNKKYEAINEKYLSGFITEKYIVNLKDGFQKAQIEIENLIRKEIYRDIGGDDQQINNMEVKYNNITFKHILLPIFVSTYRYDGKIYHFYVNGQSGKLVGQRPYSKIKILLAGLFVLFIILTIYLISTYFK